MKSAGLTLLVYLLIAWLGFGSILKPIAFATWRSTSLGAPFWSVIVAISTLLASAAVAMPERLATFRQPLFLGLAMISSLYFVGLYADRLRHDEIRRFRPDFAIENSFFESVRKAPEEYQFFLHAAVLKDCKAYAWSYRTMGFYQLGHDVTANVLPSAWMSACPILSETGFQDVNS